jgi:ABC-type Mn2+/Zn2+ transport system ATPase subunit
VTVLRGIGKRYPGSPPVLAGVDLAIRPGEVVTVGGGNGSGKSTLLRIVVGLTAPTSGTVSGRPRQVGYVPERFPGHQRMPARSYLVHMGRVRGLGTRGAQARAAALLDRLGLVGGAGSPLRNLSKGNAQKVAVAQALMVPPELAVLDEPWSGLDKAAHETLAALIDELAADGCAVVFTDHRATETPVRVDRTYRLERGRLTETHRSPSPGRGPSPHRDSPHRLDSPPHRDSPPHPDTPHGRELPPPRTSPPALVVLAGDGTEWEWRRLPGVRAVTGTEPGVVSIRVDGARCDALLAAALRAGWSVRRVERPVAR